MPESKGEKRRVFVPGEKYFSPYKPPGEAPEGYAWIASQWHEGKKYPNGWELQLINPQPPDMDTLPPVDNEGRVVELIPKKVETDSKTTVLPEENKVDDRRFAWMKRKDID